MNDHRIDLILVDLVHLAASARRKRFARISNDQVDLARNRLRRLRVVACYHHNLYACETERPDRFADTVLRRVLKRYKTHKAVVRGRVAVVRARELVLRGILRTRQECLRARDDPVAAGRHVLWASQLDN